MKQEKKQTPTRFWEKIRARYASGVAAECDTVVLCGQRGVTVYGCRKILFYSPREIRFSLGKIALSVVGERLYCSSFTGGTVTVNGHVSGVSYVNLFPESVSRTSGR